MKTYIAAFVAFLACGISITGFVMDRKAPPTGPNQAEVQAMMAEVEDDVPQQAVTLAIQSGNAILDKAEFIVKTMDIPSFLYNPIKKEYKIFLDGIDADRPVGAFAFCEEGADTPGFVFCFPISDFAEFKASLYDHNFIDTEWGITMDHDGVTYLVHPTETFAFITSEKELLEKLPKDPEAVLGSLIEDDLFAVRIDSKQIPLDWKERFWEGMETGFNSSPASVLDMSHTTAAAKDAVFGTDVVELRFDIEKETQNLAMKAMMTGLEGSRIATDSAKNRTQKPSRFSGFQFDKAAVNFNFCSNTSIDDIRDMQAVAMQSIEQAGGIPKVSGKGKEIQRVLQELFDATLDSGIVDVGGTLALKGGKPNFAMGIYVADHDKANELVEMLVNATAQEATWHKNFTTHRNTTFHKLTNNQTDAEMQRIWGGPLQGYLGIDGDVLYIAFGNDGLGLVKRCIDKSIFTPSEAPVLFSGQLRFSTLMRVAFGDTPQFKQLLEWREFDRLTFVTKTCPMGYTGSLNVGLGSIKTCMKTVEMVGAMANQEFNKLSNELGQAGPETPFGQPAMVPVYGGDPGTGRPFSKMEKTH